MDQGVPALPSCSPCRFYSDRCILWPLSRPNTIYENSACTGRPTHRPLAHSVAGLAGDLCGDTRPRSTWRDTDYHCFHRWTVRRVQELRVGQAGNCLDRLAEASFVALANMREQWQCGNERSAINVPRGLL
jgi:hypothetical protein